MNEITPRGLHADTLADITRKERRNLVIASATGVFVATLNLVPTRLSALGVEFSAPTQQQFILLVVALVAYFLGAFLVYAIPDWFAWWKRYQQYQIDIYQQTLSWDQEDQRNYEELHKDIPRMTWLHKWTVPVAFIVIFFEFAVPLILGTFSIWRLLSLLRSTI